MATKSVTPSEEKEAVKKKTVEVSSPSEIELLKAEFEKQLAELKKSFENSNAEAGSTKQEERSDVKISPDDYIRVMSLLPYTLNLSTKPAGQGNTKKFTKFGEVKRILYRDLVDIMETHSNFVEAGYFYILNPEIIRYHGLDDIYSSILTKDKIEQILSTASDDCVALYKSANEKQQETIIDLMIEKVFSNPDTVDLNIVDKISRESNVDILKRVEDKREIERNREDE